MTPETAIQIYTRTQDPDAFKVLVESYQNLVYSVCKRILPSSADVDDAVQEVFLKLSVNASRVQDSLAPWLYACAMNTCRDVLRRNRSRKQREAEYAELVDTVRGIPDAALILSEVDRALLDLSDEDRSLVIRYYLKGETQQQIANELQVSQSTIKRKSDKAIKRMRVLLRQRGISAATAAITAALWSEVTNANVPSKLTERLANIGLSDTQQFGKQFTSASSVSLVARIVLCASAAMGLIGLWYCVPTNLVSTQVQELNLAAADSSSMQGPPPMQIEEVGAQLFYVEEHDLIDGIDFNELINQVLENHREAGHERN
ncbi:MAG: sigma-70 family RNA polymerase sigma factor, partial [Planctomycetota bacterium]